MPHHYWEAQDWLNARELRIRKNGRVCDKFTIVFPKGFKQAHAVAATRMFLERVSRGHAPYRFSLQNFGDDATNPHAHCIFVDESVWNGRRVFRTSDRGSSKRLRQEWAAAANEILQQQEYTFRLDIRRQQEIRHEMAQEQVQHIPEMDPVTENSALEADHEHVDDNDAVEIAPSDAPIHELEELPEEVHARTLTHAEETAMADERGKPITLKEKVQAAHELEKQIAELDADRTRSLRLQEAYAAERELSQTAGEMARREKIALADAENELAALKGQQHFHHSRPDGRAKGFTLMGWDSPARAHAKEIEAEIRAKEIALSHRRSDHARTVTNATHQERTVWELSRQIEAHDRRLFSKQISSISDLNRIVEVFAHARQDALTGLEASEVYQAWKAGMIPQEQALTVLKRLDGGGQYVQMIREHNLVQTYKYQGHRLQ